MRRLVAIGVSIVLLAVGAGAILVAPVDERLTGPMPVDGGPNHRVAGNELAVTVHSVQLARRLGGDAPLTTAGVWVVIDLTAVPTVAPVAFRSATLTLGDTTFTVPTDVDGGLVRADAGIPTRGSIVFEVSRSALRSGGAHAELEMRTSADVFPESAPRIGMDLSHLTIQRTVDLASPTLVSR